MKIKVRRAKSGDFEKLEGILLENDMLKCPEIDGRKAMKRIKRRAGRYFLVAQTDEKVVGLIRGCYDGSRALIHQMAVDKGYQRQGIGKKLMHELTCRFKRDGAPSVSVSANYKSQSYYRNLDFFDPGIKLLVAYDINEIIKKTNEC
jgi:GNAT superfamily N-acetyltransferase